jgi:tubby and related proteins
MKSARDLSAAKAQEDKLANDRAVQAAARPKTWAEANFSDDEDDDVDADDYGDVKTDKDLPDSRTQEKGKRAVHDEWEDAGSRHQHEKQASRSNGTARNTFREANPYAHDRSERERLHAPQSMQPYALDLSNMRHFLTSPVPKAAGTVLCYIRRDKSGATNKLFPVYSLYLKEGDTFLLTSKKRPKNKTSNYLISMAEGVFSREGPSYLGKLRSNFVGTEFQIFDNGYNPRDTEDAAVTGGADIRRELAAVIYAANVLGTRGPRKMQVCVPAVDDVNEPISPARAGEEDLLPRMKDRNLRDLVYMINKPPRWNDQVGAYVLNFNGRVTMASVKNFQLVDPDEQTSVLLQVTRLFSFCIQLS